MTRNLKNLALCFIVLIALSLRCFAQSARIGFSLLPQGDTIVARFQAVGCFQFDSYEFTFNPKGNGSFAVDKVTVLRSDNGKIIQDVSKVFLGHIYLEPNETRKLDDMISYYRSKYRGGGCETVHTVEFKHMSGGRVVSQETIKYSYCDPDNAPQLLRFSAMADSLDKR
jgi:hypothetical protein